MKANRLIAIALTALSLSAFAQDGRININGSSFVDARSPAVPAQVRDQVSAMPGSEVSSNYSLGSHLALQGSVSQSISSTQPVPSLDLTGKRASASLVGTLPLSSDVSLAAKAGVAQTQLAGYVNTTHTAPVVGLGISFKLASGHTITIEQDKDITR